jgi:phosphoglycerol transferase MdoB-like AlkP superfamily enzyme
MAAQQNTLKGRGKGVLLSRRDWVYLVSLLIPFVMYDLALKSLLIFGGQQDPAMINAQSPMQIQLVAAEPPRLVEALGLLQSDLLFNLGYMMLWIVLFALTRTGRLRRTIVVVFHVLSICVALVTTIAYQYYTVTGSALDWSTLFLGLFAFDELRRLIASEVSVQILVLVCVMLLYAVFGPLLVTRIVEWWRGGMGATHRPLNSPWRHWRRVLGHGMVAVVLLSLSLLPGVGPAGVSKSFARDAFVNVMITAVDRGQDEEVGEIVANAPAAQLPQGAHLHATSATKRRNVVLIALESTRADATTPYNTPLATTPFMNELAKNSLLVERAYAIIPHTHSALTAINCGMYPPLDAQGIQLLAIPGSVPPICLPHLLQAHGYHTMFMMSHTKSFENSQQILENLGYQDFYSIEDMDTTGFEPTNYFGYEDEIMLAPSRAWLKEHRNKPFLATYLTSAPHHDYLAPFKRHGRVAFTDNDPINRYLNSVRNQDFFLKQLFQQYRRLGLYEDTVFILLGDHGQGFGEHGRNGHDNGIYEEGLRIPLLIHDPQRFRNGTRVEGPVNQLDILPTVADLLGYEIQGGLYSGSSLLQPLRADRTLMFSCSGGKGCMASLKGSEKYIDHFDDRPTELFDHAADPEERINLAGERLPDELKQRRTELVAWRAAVRAMYNMRQPE